MIQETTSASNLRCVCPECRNNVDLTKYPSVNPGMVVECNHCGMTLLVKEVVSGDVRTEIVDEGK